MQNIFYQAELELLDVSFALLSSYEFSPGIEKILDGNDIIKDMTIKPPPEQRLLPVFVHLKKLYTLWHSKFYKFPKTSRFSIGIKIDSLFLEATESVALASFTPSREKLSHIKRALSLTDTLKVFLQIAWEVKLLESKHYAEISEELDKLGRMLGGWYGQSLKQNSSDKMEEK
jgi:hypothetical protein